MYGSLVRDDAGFGNRVQTSGINIFPALTLGVIARGSSEWEQT
jgi:hypothetical protein